ncbi:MAG TPA: hypothetical protein VJJ78_03775 [Candidatus Saccharimonadales bacterium]|nr:hypothetical protein [Candidatus Saccharimonadales bacterium]
MRKLNEQGIAHVLVVVFGLVLLAGVGFAGYQVFKSKAAYKPTTENSAPKTSTSEPKTEVKDDQNYLSVKEWGVKIPVEAGHSISYELETDINKNDMGIFKTRVLEELCADNAGRRHHEGILVLRGKATELFGYSTGGEKSAYKEVYDSRVKNVGSNVSYARYIKSFILGDYYYLPPSVGFTACSDKASDEKNTEVELKYLRSAVEKMEIQ